MPSCETCYHGDPLENIFIAVILQSLLYNSYIIVVKSVWYSCFSLYLIKNSQAVKKGAAPKKAMVKKDVKSKVVAKKWL